ncbi:flavin reductase family protein [Streptomyces sp. NBC_01477]|uniref:flavin reductase family protein n=1 Tax=Streptomyces sp. NBC_01477 TaxID=2976015 RepID=UPI002E2F7777|nr:flavin reductase family protein [Streptomyces sp. NBC_01477]
MTEITGAVPTGAPIAELRSILGRFATGVTVLTGCDPTTGTPYGLAANAFASVSLDPPLIAFCVARTSTSWPCIRKARTICVNILAAHQRDVCAAFARSGGDKFARLSWSPSPVGRSPLLNNTTGWLECTVQDEREAGDHMMVLARVEELGAAPDAEEAVGPLVFYRGGFGTFQPG